MGHPATTATLTAPQQLPIFTLIGLLAVGTNIHDRKPQPLDLHPTTVTALLASPRISLASRPRIYHLLSYI